MVRLLMLFWGMLMGPLCFGAEAPYLTNAEKALVGFALKPAPEFSLAENQFDSSEYQKKFNKIKNPEIRAQRCLGWFNLAY